MDPYKMRQDLIIKIADSKQQLEINTVEIGSLEYGIRKLKERKLELECTINGYEDHLKQLGE